MADQSIFDGEQGRERKKEMLVDALMEVILTPEASELNMKKRQGEEREGKDLPDTGRCRQKGFRAAQEDFLAREALPKQLVTYGCGIFRPYQLWCVGCDGDMIRAYANMLETFRESIPRFRYFLLVSDSDPLRLRETRMQLEETGGLSWPGGEVELRFEYLEIENMALRRPQDVIILGQKLDSLVGGSPKKVLTALCELLFPGRYLLGEEDFIARYGEQQLCPVEAGVFRRTG